MTIPGPRSLLLLKLVRQTVSLLLHQVAIAAMMQTAAEKLGYKSTKDCLLGEYDYKHYCTPKWPYGKGVKASLPPFFGLKEKMPILLGMLMVRLNPETVSAGDPRNAFANCRGIFLVGCSCLES
jgi:hypothetical protein